MKFGTTVAYARNKFRMEPSLDDYSEFVKWVNDKNFNGFELAAFSRKHFQSEFSNSRKVRSLKDHYRSQQLECNAFEAGYLRYMIVDPSEIIRKKSVMEMEKIVEVASQLETNVVYAHSAPHPSWKIEWRRLYDEYSPPIGVHIPGDFLWKESWTQYLETINKLTNVAENSGLKFALEIRPYEIINNSDCMLRLIEGVESESLGVVFDTGHLFVQKEILPIAVEKLGKRIFLVHLADNDGITDNHWSPGKGKIFWGDVLQAFKKIGYQGYLNLDVAGKFKDISKEILEGKKYIENILKGIRLS